MKAAILACGAILFPSVAAEARTCGKVGRTACVPLVSEGWLEIAPRVCEEGLELWLLLGICAPELGNRLNGRDALSTIRTLGPALVEFSTEEGQRKLERIGDALRRLETGQLTREEAVELQNWAFSDPHFEALLGMMDSVGMKTMTIGFSAGGAFFRGATEEFGLAFDVAKKDLLRLYQSSARSTGFQANVGSDLVISGFVKPNGCIDGQAFGIGFAIDIGPGLGGAIWSDAAGRSEGFSSTVGLKGIGGGIANIVVDTKYLDSGICQLNAPPAPVPQPEPEPEPVVVSVKRGDTLWAIARDHLGAGVRYPEIFEANRPPLVDADLIHPGQALTIPPDEPPS